MRIAFQCYKFQRAHTFYFNQSLVCISNMDQVLIVSTRLMKMWSIKMSRKMQCLCPTPFITLTGTVHLLCMQHHTALSHNREVTFSCQVPCTSVQYQSSLNMRALHEQPVQLVPMIKYCSKCKKRDGFNMPRNATMPRQRQKKKDCTLVNMDVKEEEKSWI